MANAVKKSRKPNTKTVPSVVVLTAAAISCLASLYQRVDMGTFVMRLLVVVVIFLILGTIIKMVLDYGFKTMDDPTLIEKLENNDLEEDLTDIEVGEDSKS